MTEGKVEAHRGVRFFCFDCVYQKRGGWTHETCAMEQTTNLQNMCDACVLCVTDALSCQFSRRLLGIGLASYELRSRGASTSQDGGWGKAHLFSRTPRSSTVDIVPLQGRDRAIRRGVAASIAK